VINTRNQKLGRIVEELVWDAFKFEGFEPTRTGTGSDFKARLATAKDLELDRQEVGELPLLATYHGVPVEFLIEVKATQGDSVRMSWRQAETASQNTSQYALCVVDFTEHPDLFDRVLDEDQPTSDIIAGCMRLVPTIGRNLAAFVENLTTAVETENPGIDIEKADEIRFRISHRMWQGGCKLDDWATAVKNQVVTAQVAGE